MNKAFYIVGIVFSVILLIVTAYYAEEVSDARYDYLFSSYSSYDYNSYSSYDSSSGYSDLTVEAGLWSLFFFASFTAILLIGLIKIKTTTTKVLSIIGLSLTGIYLLWDFAVIASPGAMSFDEIAPAWILYCFSLLAFTIIGLIQSVKYQRRAISVVLATAEKKEGDLLDS